MISHPLDVLPVALRTISPAVNSGPTVVAVVTLIVVVVAEVDPELPEQPMIVTHEIRKMLNAMKILTDFSIHMSYSVLS
jgi:hypothetical protein